MKPQINMLRQSARSEVGRELLKYVADFPGMHVKEIASTDHRRDILGDLRDLGLVEYVGRLNPRVFLTPAGALEYTIKEVRSVD